MKHFSPGEFVDAVDGRVAADRRSHLDACGVCADRVAALREQIAATRDADVPEPSPLFWEHFSARVSDAIRHTTPAPRAWWRHPAVAAACSVVLVVIIGTGIRDALARRSEPPSPPAAASVPAASAAEAPTADDPAWTLLTDVAATMQEDPHAEPLAIRPSAVDRAVGDLSAAERQELRRLLEDEMKRAGN